jgi:hypothetical protein
MWNDLTFADVQRVFQEWMERLTWVIGNNGEHSPNDTHEFRKWSTVQWNRPGGQDFLDTMYYETRVECFAVTMSQRRRADRKSRSDWFGLQREQELLAFRRETQEGLYGFNLVRWRIPCEISWSRWSLRMGDRSSNTKIHVQWQCQTYHPSSPVILWPWIREIMEI